MLLTNLKVAYFTFDDGPSVHTTEILDVLDEYDVSGLFFIVGQYMDEYDEGEAVIETIVKRGHVIGLHSMSHNRQLLYQGPQSAQHFVDEMKTLQQKVKQLTQYKSTICRAPYSRKLYFSESHYTLLKQAQIDYLDWNVDSRDWSHISAAEILENVKKDQASLPDNSVLVILFHETTESVKALPDVIEYLKADGYQFGVYDSKTNLQELIRYYE